MGCISNEGRGRGREADIEVSTEWTVYMGHGKATTDSNVLTGCYKAI
jgi:hypothetical protein